MSELIQVCFALIVAGVFLYIVWIIVGMIPMLGPFKQIVMALLTLIAVVILWQILSPLILGGGGSLRTRF